MMKKTTNNKMILAGVLLAACGGGQKTVESGGSAPPPPSAIKPEHTEPGKVEPKREISKDARGDYESAIAAFTANDKGGSWNESACRGSADKFASVVRSHPDLIEAQFMVGLSYHRCNLLSDAEHAYQAAIRLKPNHGASLSNLGEIAYMNGKVSDAKQFWESAIKANGKLIAARNNMASMQLDQMRKIVAKDPTKDAGWKKLEEDAKFNLSNVLGVDNDNYKAYTLYGLIYMEGSAQNKSRLDLAKLLLDEAKKRNEKYPPLQNAYGRYYMLRSALSEALTHYQAAVDADPKFVEARMNVGLTTVNFRKYDVAKDQFTNVLQLAPKNYDAMIGLGVALRGLKDYDGAEAEYKHAKDTDPKRGEAYYNLGVLYKDFKATKVEFTTSQKVYRDARDYFKQFIDHGSDVADIAEAKEQIALCDKTIAQIDQFIKNQANQPPPPPTPPAPPAGGAPPDAPAGTAPAPAPAPPPPAKKG